MHLNGGPREEAHPIDLGFFKNTDLGPAFTLGCWCRASLLIFYRRLFQRGRLCRFYSFSCLRFGILGWGQNRLRMQYRLQAEQTLSDNPTLCCDISQTRGLVGFAFQTLAQHGKCGLWIEVFDRV